MAIRKEKYVDIVSGVGGASAASRRELIGRVFTSNPFYIGKHIAEFTSADDVMDVFGSRSQEYDFAAKYFGFVSKSITRPQKLSFAAWNRLGLDHEWKTYNVRDNGSVCRAVCEEDGSESVYANIVTCMRDLPDYAHVNAVLDGDVVIVSQETKDYTERGFSDCAVTSDTDVLHGIVVRQLQTLKLDLNGHALSFDVHCITNHGTCIVTDSVGTGCVFTTNFSDKIDGNNHVDASWGKSASADTIWNYGFMQINGGWFGTNVPTLEPRINDVNWGLTLNCEGGEIIVNGGHFTNCFHRDSARKFYTYQKEHGQPVNETFLNTFQSKSTKQPWAFIGEAHYAGHITVNGGVFYGLTNGGFGAVGDRNETTEDVYTAIVVNGGEFYAGFPSYVAPTTVSFGSFIYAGTNGDVPSSQRNKKPSEVPDYSFARALIKGGSFTNNTAFANFTFSGRVSVVSCSTERTDIDADFFAFKCEVNDAKREKVETAEEALSRVNEADDNFGAFCFIESLDDSELRAVSALNATYNFKYLHSVAVTPENAKRRIKAINGASGTVVTLDKFDEKAYFMPMALLAATKYDRANATKCFMYQQFDGVRPSVTTTREAEKYDAFDVDGLGTTFAVNYYGCTHQAGGQVCFFQDGYNVDKIDTAVFCNEMWMKDAFAVEILNTFIAVEKIPANDFGLAMVKAAMLTVINEALANGTVCIEKELTQTQKTYIDTEANAEGTWTNVSADGYWMDIAIRQVANNGRTTYYADYVLIYSKGDAIRKVEGSNIMI